MIKHNVVVHYDKILVNVATYVVAGEVCVVRRSGVNTETSQSSFNINLHYLFVHMLVLVYNTHINQYARYEHKNNCHLELIVQQS
jgi:hypothetical protein